MFFHYKEVETNNLQLHVDSLFNRNEINSPSLDEIRSQVSSP